MDFALNDEQKAFQDSVYKFAKNELHELTHEAEHKGEFSWEAWRKMAEFGMMALPFPEEYGGHDAGIMMTMLGMEALAHGGCDAGTCLAWGAHTILCGVPIWLVGNEEQKKKFLPKIASGEWVGGFGLTEPEAGSDAAGTKTTAVKKGDKYILNGSKMFITNGPIGKMFIVMAVTNKAAGHFGISAFIVESDSPGFSVGKELDKMGNRSSTTSELIFEDCEVPAGNMLGQEGSGFIVVGKSTLEWERSCLLAAGVGGMARWVDICTQYAKERRQFNRPIGAFQGVQHMLADMKMKHEASRMALYRVGWMKENNRDAMLEASMAKLFISECGESMASDAVQIHGGYGYMKEYEVEAGYRDCKLGTIGAGTSEVQRMIISKMLLNTRKKGGKK